MVSAWITSGWLASARIAPALLDVVAVEADDQRLVGLVAEHLQRADDAVGHRVARGDAAEHVDEHALDLAVAEDDVEPAAITSAEAPPPMSRKLAGFTPPCFSPA